ncbi:MAG: YceI family protein [Pseudomonadales bacterium]|jgi:polyisoprenoid-binding protein YceI|nr:YceI family protein [Pseudomonadales bacterium]
MFRKNAARALVTLSLVAGCALAASARADWTLVPDDSAVTFVTVKNGAIAEAHYFRDFSGTVDADAARLVIELASVDTLIPIRDERMREMLFEIAEFPKATFEAPVGTALLDDLAPGETKSVEVAGTLSIHGVTRELEATLLLTRAGDDRVLVATTAPVIVSADALDLGEGVERLREVAGLNSITPMVPVELVLSFARDE